MLGTIEVLYKNYDDKLYRKVCERLPLYKEEDTEHTSKVCWNNEDPHSPIRRVTCYSIYYNNSNRGRIWWIIVTVDLRLLFQTEDYSPVPASRIGELESRIDDLFGSFFGFDIKIYLPDIVGKDLIDKRISYLEYMIYIKKVDAGSLIKRLDRAYFAEKQLDPQYFDRYWVRNATPAFTINKIDDETVRLCIKCKETAIKTMFKKVAGPNADIANEYLFNRENVVDAFCKQIKKYTKPLVFEELNRAAIEESL